MLEQYRVADFIEWQEENKLRLNPDFQRGSVWASTARVYLIDTLLRELPIPKIYLRTTIDPINKKSMREVVDGQQRLRAILDFAADRFRLSSRAQEYSGRTYSTLEPEDRARFLEYPLAVEQLVNADEDFVLEVFNRLNSYTVTLNPAEKRHAKYQGTFKWAVRDLSREYGQILSRYGILSVRQRVRMEDDVIMAQLLVFLVDGLREGSADVITRYYDKFDKDFPGCDDALGKTRDTLNFILENLMEFIEGTSLATAPQFLMLGAAVMHVLHGIPKGGLDAELPRDRKFRARTDISAELFELDLGISNKQGGESSFALASISNMHRMPSRQTRFLGFLNAISE